MNIDEPACKLILIEIIKNLCYKNNISLLNNNTPNSKLTLKEFKDDIRNIIKYYRSDEKIYDLLFDIAEYFVEDICHKNINNIYIGDIFIYTLMENLRVDFYYCYENIKH